MKGNMSNSLIQTMVNTKFDNVLENWVTEKNKDRFGLHASEILKTPGSFCFRRCLLNYFYNNPQEDVPSKDKIQYYFGGEGLHRMWEDVVDISGSLIMAEAPMYSEKFELWYTPDQIIKAMNRTYIVEVKTMSEKSYNKFKSVPISFRRQMQLYMHLTGIPNGIVLVQNRNNLEFEAYAFEYNPSLITEHIERLYKLNGLKKNYIKSGYDEDSLPNQECRDKYDSKAKYCSACELCMMDDLKRQDKLKTKFC